MKKFNSFFIDTVISICFLFIPLGIKCQTIIVSGDIMADTTWSADTVKVTGDITIPDSVSLIINPGTYIEFQGHFKIIVYGIINAMGAPDDTIIFTVDDTTGFYNLPDTSGSWGGIRYHGTQMSSFYYCKFQNSKAVGKASYEDDMGGALYASFIGEELVIKYCHFHNNYADEHGGAICVRGSIGPPKPSLIIEECRFTYNQAKFEGGAIHSDIGSIKLIRNYLTHNHAAWGGAINITFNSELEITGNKIVYNSANKYGGAIYCASSYFALTNNIISNNYAGEVGGGISCYSSLSPILTGNLIVNNTAGSEGGGIYLSETNNAIIINNTVCNNSSLWGGGFVSYASTPDIYNSIFYGNLPSQISLINELSSPNIYYSNIEGGISNITGSTFHGQANNNIDTLPQFTTSSTGAGYTFDGIIADWSLLDTSPCINGGNPDISEFSLPEKDVYGNQRIRNNIVDIGAAETHIDVINISGNITEDTFWFADTIKINSDVTVQDGVSLKINVGTVIQFQDFYKLSIKGKILACGTRKDTILFTVPADKRSTGWAGIEFDNRGEMFDNDSSIIDHCRFEYARKKGGAAIFSSHFSDLRVSNSTFMYDSVEINYAGAAIYIMYCSPIILNNLFMYNTVAIHVYYGNPVIIGNTFKHNYKGIYGVWSNFLIKDNFITNNEWGIFFENDNTNQYVLINNIIANNEFEGIYSHGINTYALNNSIVNNGSGLSSSRAKLTLINNIIYGNDNNLYLWIPDDSVKIYNCNIQGGWESGFVGGSSELIIHTQNIDANPNFLNPSIGTGWNYESVPVDWQLISISPCINTGTSNNLNYPLPADDILGQPRINNSSIDIGAIENQSKIPVIVNQPIGAIKCSGDSINMEITVNDTVFYQWQKDNVDMPGENQASLEINSLKISDEGYYQCIITNAYGMVKSTQVYLVVRKAPEISLEPKSIWLEKNESHTLRVSIDGTPPLSYQWQKDGMEITGATSPEYSIPDPYFNDEGDYTCIISNFCGEVSSTPAILYLAPQICMVTVDPLTGNNLVIWEKKSKAPLVALNVYRESQAAGIYDLMGKVSYENLSIFVDTTADPTVQAYIYKITGIDTSGYETDIDLCKPHKTIHLLVSTNPELNTTQLEWDKYYGFEYQTYHILRSATGTNFTEVHALASSLASWTDPDPLPDVGYYRITVEKPDPCYPTGGNKKADAGPYSHSMSNMEDNRLQSGQNPPDTITLSNYLIDENKGYGILIGRFNTTDLDSLDTHTYSLVTGEGDDDNTSFTILGDMLLAAEIFDYELKDLYTIRVRCTDKHNLTREEVFVIYINDIIETSMADYRAAGQIQVYPNPFNKSTTLLFNNPESEPYTLYIMDLSGKICRIEDHINTSRYTLEKGNLKEGFYFIEMRGSQILRGRIIIE